MPMAVIYAPRLRVLGDNRCVPILRAAPVDAAAVLRAHLKEVLEYLEREHVTVTVSIDGVKADSNWKG
jgi:hypothetical protein